MAGFSSSGDDVIERIIDVRPEPSISSENELIEKFDLKRCVEWIKEKNLTTVCLQFPDSLLHNSVQIALWLEKQTSHKVYILGDTSYGSCCVDEVASEHVNADGIIHFGHACLSPTSRLPVLYIFPKAHLDVEDCADALKTHLNRRIDQQTLILFDIQYHHCKESIKNHLSDFENLIFAELLDGSDSNTACSSDCQMSTSKEHTAKKLGRTYCLDGEELDQIIFIGPYEAQTLYNHSILFSGTTYYYTDGTVKDVSFNRSVQRRYYLMERLKDAKSVGILVATLGVDGYLKAVDRIRALARRRQKKCYVISVGKPNAAKLANFPEIDVYVMISCPEAVLESEKDFLQPVLSLAEAELALNETRPFTNRLSKDFRDFIPGGECFEPLPSGTLENEEPDVSLLSNKIRCVTTDCSSEETCSDQSVQTRANMSVNVVSSHLSNRTWQGLDPAIGQTEVVKAVLGRSGIASGYSNEQDKPHISADDDNPS
ncbi:2-(3-amino-3-carboxypropyl)histidine synthase subunit 2 isoform X2 [Nilaparvata lugens]|nr:2-(3-amino-3-carboxypropyl)histidine synthase subunit 2 isoform X2 [Nilaparvata lugens]